MISKHDVLKHPCIETRESQLLIITISNIFSIDLYGPTKFGRKSTCSPKPGNITILCWVFFFNSLQSDFSIEIVAKIPKSLKFPSSLCILLNIFQ